MNWTNEQQARFDDLRQRDLAGALSSSEEAELDELTAWLTAVADTALSPAVAQMIETQTTLRQQLQRQQEKNEALAGLLHQQEQLVAETRRWLADFDKRQSQISQTYSRLTGNRLTPV
jgi:predicted nuclease with TOPRIM domain